MSAYQNLKVAAQSSANPAAELLALFNTLEAQRQEILGFISRRDAHTIYHACQVRLHS